LSWRARPAAQSSRSKVVGAGGFLVDQKLHLHVDQPSAWSGPDFRHIPQIVRYGFIRHPSQPAIDLINVTKSCSAEASPRKALSISFAAAPSGTGQPSPSKGRRKAACLFAADSRRHMSRQKCGLPESVALGKPAPAEATRFFKHCIPPPLRAHAAFFRQRDPSQSRSLRSPRHVQRNFELYRKTLRADVRHLRPMASSTGCTRSTPVYPRRPSPKRSLCRFVSVVPEIGASIIVKPAFVTPPHFAAGVRIDRAHIQINRAFAQSGNDSFSPNAIALTASES